MQDTGLNRKTIDKFYTKKIIVDQCIELIKTHLNILKEDLIIEPSAGNGAFISKIKSITDNYKFYDIEPENQEVIKMDFLELDIDPIKTKYNKIHIIGNPPFGRQSSSAIKFIKKCCSFSSSISFILPKSFKKDSLKKYFSNNFHLVHEIDLINNAFIINNVECDVPCVFQIWKYKDELRNEIKKIIPIGFEFVSKDEKPDVSFRRVGVYAGNISKDIQDKSIQSHYFIKFINNKTIDENLDKLKNIKFESNNTVGPKSISKQELIKEFNKVIN
jgi:predicted RNA methylase